MESLINKSTHPKTTSTKKSAPVKNSPTNPSTNAYVSEFMDFMAGLPTVYKEFTENSASLGGDLDRVVEERSENVSGITPYSNEERAKMGRKKIDLSNPRILKVVNSIQSMRLGKEDQDYLLTLGNRESSLNPDARQGSFKGLYQFNKDSLKTVGITEKEYKTDLLKQHEAAIKYKYINLKMLSKYQKYIGTTFKGVPITANGLAAAGHLLGAGTVMDWFDGTKHSDRAKKGFVDALGTNISEYFQLFA